MFSAYLQGGVLVALSSLAVASSVVSASDAQTTLSAVLNQTLEQHPTLRQISAKKLARDPLQHAAGFRPPFSLALDVENLAGSGSFSSADRVETTLSLAGVLEWPGKPALRQGEVASETQRLLIALDQQRRDVLAAAASRFVQLAGYEAKLSVYEQAQALMQSTLDATQRRHQMGAASAADVQRARLALLTANQQYVRMQRLVEGAQDALSLAVGDPDWRAGTAVLNWRDLPELPPRERITMASSSALRVQEAQAGEAVARARLRQTRAQAKPDLQWSVGMRHERESGDMAMLAGVGIALGNARRSEPQQAALRQDVEAAEWGAQAVELEVAAFVAQAWSELSSLRAEFYALREQLQPVAQSLVDSTVEGYRDGRYSLLELISAQNELLRLRQRKVEVIADFHQIWIDLERVLGQALEVTQ